MRGGWFLARVVSLLGPWESAVATFPVWPEFLVSGLRSASCWSPCVCEATATVFPAAGARARQYVEKGEILQGGERKVTP